MYYIVRNAFVSYSSQNEPITDGTVPKKVYVRNKTRAKPPPEKIMVKREVQRKLMYVEEEDDTAQFDDDDDEEEDNGNTNMFLRRSRRNAKMPIHFHGEYPLSPLSVTYAANYDAKENQGWVKPIFSSIVYRLPVSLPITTILILRARAREICNLETSNKSKRNLKNKRENTIT